ncbi:hypothetical protein [Desulfonatronum lacustre]|uniref:hypothetical protein n=1 Tax=Desulfonatronum lacustre TaxID=66849 RepID=UPI00048B3C7B|nr:hypothetical protein [Desulfonatronum lacustre]
MAETSLSNVVQLEKPENQTVLLEDKANSDFPEFQLKYVLPAGDNQAHFEAFLNGLRAFYLLIDRHNSSGTEDDPPLPSAGLLTWAEALLGQYWALWERGFDFFEDTSGKVGFFGVSGGLRALVQVLRSQDEITHGADVVWVVERLEEHRCQILEGLGSLKKEAVNG